MAKTNNDDVVYDLEDFDVIDENDDTQSISNDTDNTSSQSGVDDNSTDSNNGTRRARRTRKRNSTKSLLDTKKSEYKFKIILIFNDFFNKSIQNNNRLIYDIENTTKSEQAFTPDIVYGITDTHEIIPILKIIILKKKLLDKKKDDNSSPQSAPNLFFMYFIQDSTGSNKYKMNEINLYQTGAVEQVDFIVKSNYIYELYHNFKGESFTDSQEYYLIVKDKIPFSNKFKILHIFYNFDITQSKVKFTNIFVTNNNTLSNSIGISGNGSVKSETSREIPILKLKGQTERSFGKGVTAIQLETNKDPFEVGRCIKKNNEDTIYRISQINLDKRSSLEDNHILLSKLDDNFPVAPQISELRNYNLVRCTENDNECKSVKFKDNFLIEACSSKDAYNKFKKDNLTADQMLNKKYNKNCEKDAEILRKKCDMMKNNKGGVKESSSLGSILPSMPGMPGSGVAKNMDDIFTN